MFTHAVYLNEFVLAVTLDLRSHYNMDVTTLHVENIRREGFPPFRVSLRQISPSPFSEPFVLEARFYLCIFRITLYVVMCKVDRSEDTLL